MIGIVARAGDNVVVAVAETIEGAEIIARELLATAGEFPDELNMVDFDPTEMGGLMIEVGESPPMDGWSVDGWMPE